jgi:hypothetical protein
MTVTVYSNQLKGSHKGKKPLILTLYKFMSDGGGDESMFGSY